VSCVCISLGIFSTLSEKGFISFSWLLSWRFSICDNPTNYYSAASCYSASSVAFASSWAAWISTFLFLPRFPFTLGISARFGFNLFPIFFHLSACSSSAGSKEIYAFLNYASYFSYSIAISLNHSKYYLSLYK